MDADLPRDFLGLAWVVLLLGVKHGLDADHLAAVDGLTRYNAALRPRLARWAGTLFSLGHGLVVVGVAIAVSTVAQTWRAPLWLGAFGAWVSIALLTLLGLLNIGSVLKTPSHQTAQLMGWRCAVFSRLLRAASPAAVAAVGALFALSFDTLSQAALFAVTATRFGGWQAALGLALLFVGGMLLTDGLNGWWIARLVRRCDQKARIASRVMALALGGVSLLTAALGAATLALPAAQAWAEGKSLWFGSAIVAVVLVSCALARQLARQRPAPAALLARPGTAPRANFP